MLIQKKKEREKKKKKMLILGQITFTKELWEIRHPKLHHPNVFAWLLNLQFCHSDKLKTGMCS